ncbi:hypothetical protein SLA2020_029310 [Shorea laevis]
MDLPSITKFGENHGNTNTRIPEQNVHVNNQTLTIAQIESMRQQPVYSDPHFQGGNSGSIHSMNLISSEQDLPGETEQMMMRQQQSGQRQPADISSADSSEQNYHPVNKYQTVAETEHMARQQQSGQRQLPDISTADSAAVLLDRKRKAKSEADRRYREKNKIERANMELKVRTLEAETKSLREQFEAETKSLRQQFEAETKSIKEQLDFTNQGCETKQRELDKLREDLIELEKKYNNQYKQQASMELKVTALEAEKEKLEGENRRLKDKYIELLEKSNPLVDPWLGTLSKEPGRQHGQTTNSSSERVFGSSGIDSITQ